MKGKRRHGRGNWWLKILGQHKKSTEKEKFFRSALAVLAVFFTFALLIFLYRKQNVYRWHFPKTVLQHREMLERVAKEKGLSSDLEVLYAIMNVESGGRLRDVMQSSESMGLPVNTLDTEDSIEQGLSYYKELKEKTRELSLDDKSLWQAYNYGIGFLYYVKKHGGQYQDSLAEDFAMEQSGGKLVAYKNKLAIAENGGYRYQYGNMFYARLIEENILRNREKNKMEFSIVNKILMTVSGVLFLYIMLLETFMTDSESTARVFKMTVRDLRGKNLNTLFKNQGIYNGLLGIALLYGTYRPGGNIELSVVILSMMFLVAVYGGLSSDKSILLKQGGLPFLSLVSLFLRW
ncbi:DUF1304 family protein [Oribacterium sp. oral taxon 108]|uniref:DUF1304 family protein n=1 Tax=Oribacterium sp. oral taxon 108 TaxID=712414 RepID=UPI000563F1A7|nr:DUF1304 family protein [Oribacterium sp. oral taxon 108]